MTAGMCVPIKIVDLSFTTEELHALVDDPCAHVFLKHNVIYPISLRPSCLNDVNAAVFEHLDGAITRYLPQYEGILLGYKNIKRLGNTGTILNNDFHIHITIRADLYVFAPTIGCILKGVVIKKSEDKVVCLVHKGFNVAIPRGSNKEWRGSDVKVGQNLLLQVKFLNLQGELPYIRAEFLVESEVENLRRLKKERKVQKKKLRELNLSSSGNLDDADIALEVEEIPLLSPGKTPKVECRDIVKVRKNDKRKHAYSGTGTEGERKESDTCQDIGEANGSAHLLTKGKKNIVFNLSDKNSVMNLQKKILQMMEAYIFDSKVECNDIGLTSQAGKMVQGAAQKQIEEEQSKSKKLKKINSDKKAKERDSSTSNKESTKLSTCESSTEKARQAMLDAALKSLGVNKNKRSRPEKAPDNLVSEKKAKGFVDSVVSRSEVTKPNASENGTEKARQAMLDAAIKSLNVKKKRRHKTEGSPVDFVSKMCSSEDIDTERQFLTKIEESSVVKSILQSVESNLNKKKGKTPKSKSESSTSEVLVPGTSTLNGYNKLSSSEDKDREAVVQALMNSVEVDMGTKRKKRRKTMDFNSIGMTMTTVDNKKSRNNFLQDEENDKIRQALLVSTISNLGVDKKKKSKVERMQSPTNKSRDQIAVKRKHTKSSSNSDKSADPTPDWLKPVVQLEVAPNKEKSINTSSSQSSDEDEQTAPISHSYSNLSSILPMPQRFKVTDKVVHNTLSRGKTQLTTSTSVFSNKPHKRTQNAKIVPVKKGSLPVIEAAQPQIKSDSGLSSGDNKVTKQRIATIVKKKSSRTTSSERKSQSGSVNHPDLNKESMIDSLLQKMKDGLVPQLESKSKKSVKSSKVTDNVPSPCKSTKKNKKEKTNDRNTNLGKPDDYKNLTAKLLSSLKNKM